MEKSPMKNIIINFRKAIAPFSTLRLAEPYLQPYLDDGNFDLTVFILLVKKE